MSCDEEGVLRVNEYDPHGMYSIININIVAVALNATLLDPDSRHGQRLLCRTEFNAQTEYRTSCTIARRGKGVDAEVPQAKLICGASLWWLAKIVPNLSPLGMVDGSLSSLTYVDEAVSKRLHLLQGQLTRNVQHVAGLNPKAFRYHTHTVPKHDYKLTISTQGRSE